MKYLMLVLFLMCFMVSQAQFTDDGHPEHVVGGMVIGGVTSYLVFRKTDNKVKSWLIGTGAATALGLIKELIDPSIGRERSGEDFGYTVLGGAIGASIVIPLKKKRPKEVAYLF